MLYIYVYVDIYIYVTVTIFKVKLFGKEQALTNIKVRRNVIPRGQMRLFNLSVC